MWFFVALACLAAELASESDAKSASEPSANSREALLSTFHDEFVPITPGEGQFPAQLEWADPPRTLAGPAAYAMARYEVPQNLYEAVMGVNPSRWKGARNSVEMVSLAEAREFCQKATAGLRELKKITDKQEIRLPTEDEWEYAARAGSLTRYSFGDDAGELGEYGWFTGNAAGNDPAVGAKRPNSWGLYDMHGYLWEWCQSDQTADSETPKDATAKDSASKDLGGMLRGGSWKDKAEGLAFPARRAAEVDLRDDAVGFRCVIELVP